MKSELLKIILAQICEMYFDIKIIHHDACLLNK